MLCSYNICAVISGPIKHQVSNRCDVMYSEQNEMKKQVRLLDVLHWQIKRCVNGSLCEACRDANTVSEMTETEHRSLDDSVCEPPTDSGSRPLTYIAGVDISFVKNDNINACAACVVVKLPDFDVSICTLFKLMGSISGQ